MRCLASLLLCVLPLSAAAQAASAAQASPPPLRVCADPDSWPLSHRDGTGLENRLAALLADALGTPLHTEWIVLQGRLVGATLSAGRCDLLMGVPTGFPRAATSRPYYRSSFVWVQPAGQPPLGSLADERLGPMRIGVPRIRHDVAATPPAWALQQQGGGSRLVGYAQEEGRMPERLVEAVAKGEVDAAALWGPQAGWFVQRQRQRLQLTPVASAPAFAHLPLQVDISLAVRASDRELLARLDGALLARRTQIDALLEEFGVPVLPRP